MVSNHTISNTGSSVLIVVFGWLPNHFMLFGFLLDHIAMANVIIPVAISVRSASPMVIPK